MSGRILYILLILAFVGECSLHQVAGSVVTGSDNREVITAGEYAGQEASKGVTINIAPLGKVEPEWEISRTDDGILATIIGRTYIWWQGPSTRTGNLIMLEMQADNIVLWLGSSDDNSETETMARSYDNVTDIYVGGDVLFQQGYHTISAEHLYYDTVNNKAYASETEFRIFDTARNIPIYIRASEILQFSSGNFVAKDVTLTTSEFHTPQLSANAKEIIFNDNTTGAEPAGQVSDSAYRLEMREVSFEYYGNTFFGLPKVVSNLERPDTPLKGIRAGYDSTFGASVETKWYLNRVLGLEESSTTNSTLMLDYYGNRGPGGGIEIEYEDEGYFGRILGYYIYDTGEDRLGRGSTRRSVEPDQENRGRFLIQHRQFLPYGWQLTAEAGYLSDRNFLEQYYRDEFNVGKDQETLLHLKRIDDNWGISLLAKARINDFQDEVEELPSAEMHIIGQSLWSDKLTYYSSNRISQFRHLHGMSPWPTGYPAGYYMFASTRNEVDMPFSVGNSRIVPFTAITFGYDDGAGFYTDIDGTTTTSRQGIWIGEAGVRASAAPIWKVYPDIQSRLLDLNQIRHIISPTITAVGYTQGDSVAEQRDTLSLGLSQRLQTKRGPADKQRTVDWLIFDLDFTWVSDPANVAVAPDRFIWNKPFIPLANLTSITLPPMDRRSSDFFGPRRNNITADMALRLSDTTAILADAYYDTENGKIEQFNIGFSRYRWPNLGYYIGSRYLRRFDNGLGQVGSCALTFAATYVLDSRYSVVFSEQYDLEYEANIRTDITLIRKYHRLNFGLTFSADESLDQTAIIFTIWPEGVPELATGLRNYMGLGGSAN